MSLMRSAGTFLAAAVLWAGCAGSAQRAGKSLPPSETVVAEGWAPLDVRDPDGTRRRALTDAQYRAAEQVNGASVAASTLVAESVGVRSRILSETSGGIARYEVLEESREGGFLKVRIRAVVQARSLGTPAEAPPLGITVSVAVKADGPRGRAWEGAAADALRWQFLARGFSVFEPAGSQARPDLSLRAEARAEPVEDPRLGGFRSYVATLSLRAVRPDTGEVVWEGVREASALDTDAGSASSQAVASAGLSVGRDAAAALSRLFWRRF